MSNWDLASEIFTDYEGTITEATFRFNEYGGQMSFTFDEIDGREQPTFENYNLPPGWESNDGGETIERVSGDGKGIVKSSQWGKFLGSVSGCEGARDVLGEDAPVSTSPWIGCRFKMEVTELGVGKPYSFTDKDTGEKKSGMGKDKNYPVAFLGKDSQVSAQTPSSSNGSGNGTVDSLSVLTDIPNPVVQSRIQELAKTLPHGEWFKQSYALLSANDIQPAQYPDLITAMGGRGLYESLGGKG